MGRLERVNEQIKRDISLILLEDLADPRLSFVSITHVSISKDLRNATVYFSVLGNAAQVKAAEEGLNRAKKVIRRELGARLKIRYTPDLHFIYDDSLQFNALMEETIKEIPDEF